MAEYFSHDYASRDDEKIRNVMFQFGWEGYGIYWGLVESLYQNDGYMQTHFDRIAYEMRIEKSMLISIISDFGLFKTHDDLFYSKSVLHRLKLRKGKSMAAKKAAEIRWGKGKQKDANALQTHNDSNAIKERKVKESKVKESKEEYICKIQEKFYQSLTPFLDKFDKQEIRKFYDYWSEPNKSKTKIKWQLEKTWDTNKRLIRWTNNKFNEKIRTNNNKGFESDTTRGAIESVKRIFEQNS